MASSSDSLPLLPLYRTYTSDNSESDNNDNGNGVPSVVQNEPKLAVTVRFASHLPDLPLIFDHPFRTTIAELRRRIRAARPEDTARRRLRLIYAGKVLTDTITLAGAVDFERSAQSQEVSESHDEVSKEFGDGKGKGKEKLVSVEDSAEVNRETIRSLYVHCSIGDELTERELLAEAEIESVAVPQKSTLPAPQGFDRLLSAGFTEADIAALRSQFHDTLASQPSGPSNSTIALSLLDDEARRHALALEERWIDESANASNFEVDNATTGGNGGTWGTSTGSYEDFLVGVLWGFFWPVCVVWMFREEGLLASQRKKMAVLAGLLVNFVFSLLRLSS